MSARRSLTATLVLASATALVAPLLAAAAPATAGSASGPGAPPGAPTARAAVARPVAPVVPRIAWAPCPSADQKGFDCARVRVPLDYDTPRDGRTVTLALVRHRATGGRLGTVFFNPGGPGGPGTEDLPAWLGFFPRQVVQRFDLVSWDPRGVGASTAAQCFDTDAQGIRFFSRVPAAYPVGRAQVRTFLEAYSRFGAVCRARQGELLRHLSTADTARDLDLLRQAVGSRDLNYIGVSYGTFLGATYANLFPSRVRALVLDGNVAPSSWTNGGRRTAGLTTTSYRIGSHLGLAATFEQFLRLCTAAGPQRCAFAAPTLSQTRAKWQELLVRTRRAPIPFEGKPITYAALVNEVGNLLFVSRPSPGFPGWPALAQILQTLHTGGSGGTPRPPQYPDPEAQAAVECGDSPNPRDPRAYPRVARKAVARAGAFGAPGVWADAACVDWPRQQDTYRGPFDRRTARPILVIGNTFDPATPYLQSVKAVHELRRARLLTMQGWGHTALLNPSRCVQDRVSAYLVRGSLPPVGTVCAQDATPFDPVP